MEIAVIGNSDFVIGFKLAGVRKAYEVNKDIESKIQGVLQDRNVGVLVLHQDDFKKLPKHLQKLLDESIQPTIVVIGGESESTSLREKIKQSIGVDLWK